MPAARARIFSLFAVQVLGGLIILTSLLQMAKLAGDLIWYEQIFFYLPPLVLAGRYGVSWGLRIIGLTAGIGIIRRREAARRIIIGIAVFTILTVAWKHPLAGFVLHARYLDAQHAATLARMGLETNFFSSLAHVSRMSAVIGEVLVQSALIFYVTRPQVREWFTGPCRVPGQQAS